MNLPDTEIKRILETGTIVSCEQIRSGSNYTFLVHIDSGSSKPIPAIYKPRDGETPLYDFPIGSLHKREYASFLLSRTLGWPAIPLTSLRDGPYGIGSMQLFIELFSNATYFDLVKPKREEFLPFVVFDFISNNADRKAGHCILGKSGEIWGIDHGLTFHHDFKLRTVMLDLFENTIPPKLLNDVESLSQQLQLKDGITADLKGLLTTRELDALSDRINAILRNPLISELTPYYEIPWPLV